MQLNVGSNGWSELLQHLRTTELVATCKRSVDNLYYNSKDSLQSEIEPEFASIRDQIYYSPKEIPRTAQEGMPVRDEKRVRLFSASMIRKVGVLLSIPIETISIAQNILHRFYYR